MHQPWTFQLGLRCNICRQVCAIWTYFCNTKLEWTTTTTRKTCTVTWGSVTISRTLRGQTSILVNRSHPDECESLWHAGWQQFLPFLEIWRSCGSTWGQTDKLEIYNMLCSEKNLFTMSCWTVRVFILSFRRLLDLTLAPDKTNKGLRSNGYQLLPPNCWMNVEEMM